MLLCLSSGGTPQYRQDILRALSKPAGAELRFRYELELVAASLQEDIAGLVGEEVCIAYLDRSDPNAAPAVVPVRSGRVINAEALGDFCVIDFLLGEYLVARKIDDFDRELRSAVGTLPSWDPVANGTLIGKFCDRLQRDLASLVKSNTVADWQHICKTLSTHADFNAEPFFYRVEGLFNLDTGASIVMEKGAYSVPADALIELRLLHYAPSLGASKAGINNTSWLTAETNEDALAIITSPRLVIDSGYDLKGIRMRAAAVTQNSDSVVTLTRKPPRIAGEVSDPIWDFDLAVRVKRNLRRTIWQGGLLGLLVAGQGLVATWNNTQIVDKGVPSFLVVLLGLATGYVAIFNLRKP